MRDWYWYLFRDPNKYLKDLIETRGEDDFIVDVECRYVLRSERLRWRLRHPVRAWNKFRRQVQEWFRHPAKPRKSLAESIAEKVSTDPEAAGFTKEGIEALTKAKEAV